MMDSKDLGARSRPVEWLTLAVIVGCYVVWFMAGHFLWPLSPFLAFVLLTLTVALQSSLMHENCHGHPTRSAVLNELLVALPIGLVWPFRRFKAVHLKHHADVRLTDPFDDPESYYKALFAHEKFPGWFKAVLRVNNTLLGRVILNPLLGSVGLAVSDARAILAGDSAIAGAWVRHALGLAVIVPLILNTFDMPFWLYVLGPAWLGQSLIAVRTYAEHQWHETPEGRTIIVERSPLSFLFLNNNLHLVHHKYPALAWYKLPALFAASRDEWGAMNGGYVFPNYRALAVKYLLRAKEPVVHPVLRRTPECGGAAAYAEMQKHLGQAAE